MAALLAFADAADLAAARARAESSGDDAQLYALRSLEIAAHALPPVIDGARRLRLLCADPIATTWEAWDLRRATRVLIRAVRPQWRRDPVMLRRLARAQHSPEPPLWLPDGDWPHLRVVAPGPLLLDRLPVEDAPDTPFLARMLGAGVETLSRLHAAGLVHGGPMEAFLVEGEGGPRLLWLDTFEPSWGPEGDLAALGAAVAALDPEGLDPVAALAADWAEAPPPSARDAARLLRRLLRGHLVEARHRLELRARRRIKRTDAARLRVLAGRLAAFPPPRGRFCLYADPGGAMVLAESDGREVRGGAAAEADARLLPVVWTPERGLDVQAARALRRAWALRDQGAPDARLSAQRDLRASDEATDALLRWLAAMTQLRTLRLLLTKRNPGLDVVAPPPIRDRR